MLSPGEGPMPHLLYFVSSLPIHRPLQHNVLLSCTTAFWAPYVAISSKIPLQMASPSPTTYPLSIKLKRFLSLYFHYIYARINFLRLINFHLFLRTGGWARFVRKEELQGVVQAEAKMMI